MSPQTVNDERCPQALREWRATRQRGGWSSDAWQVNWCRKTTFCERRTCDESKPRRRRWRRASSDGIRLRWPRATATMQGATWWWTQREVVTRSDASQNEAVPRADPTLARGSNADVRRIRFLSNKPMMLAALGALWIARPAQCGSISASRWADNGRRQRATGDGLRFTAEAQRAQRSERSSERRATSGRARIGPTSGVQRSTKWRVASCEWPPRPRVLHRPRTTGRRATRNFHKPQRGDGRRVLRRHRATGRRATCHLYNPRRGDGRRRDAGLPQPRNGEATGVDFTCTRLKRRRRCDGTANDGHSPRGDERRGTATGGERRAAIRNTASRAGVPNKPMMLAAPGVLWIARPAHCGSISASR